MDPIYAGWLSIIPPIIAIALALITKEVISSLIIGILSGTLIYSCIVGANPIVGTVDYTFQLMASRVDINIILFLALPGRARSSRQLSWWFPSIWTLGQWKTQVQKNSYACHRRAWIADFYRRLF